VILKVCRIEHLGKNKNMQRAFWPDTQHCAMCQCVTLTHSPSEVARSLPPECVEKGLNGAGECVVSEIEIDLVMSYAETMIWEVVNDMTPRHTSR
jgi:hypothetical protein